MNIMNKIPYELKMRVMSYLPVISTNKKVINGIIKNYKYYFLKALIEEYNKHYDKESFYLYMEMCLTEWAYIANIMSRIGPIIMNQEGVMKIMEECTLKEIQYLYLFITFRLQTPCF